MPGLVECVPNFSEGRDPSVVDRIVAAMTAVPGVRLLDRSMDAGHNRSVVTIIGSPEAVGEAAYRGVAQAAQLIDLRVHRGEHPRMGAADVVPFIPLRNVTMEECVALARAVGERIGRDLSIPVFLYEEAATHAERRNLADVRGPQFEGLLSLVGTDPSKTPDFGPNALHPTAGAVAVGARHLLVAYNVYLNTADQSIAKAIAKAVRHQGGGLRFVKALGIAPNEAGRVHVSMNLVNTSGTPIHRVMELIRSEAARYGVTTVESEIVGLVSADALLDAAEHYLQLNAFSRSQVLEYRLLEEEPSDPSPLPKGEAACQSTLREDRGEAASGEALLQESVAGFADRVASGDAVPGGGSVSAFVGSLAAALVAMVSRLTLGRRRFADVEGRMKELEERAESMRTRLLRLVEEDSAAYATYMSAAREAKRGADGATAALQEAALQAARIPLETARASLGAIELALEASRLGNPVARTDACVAALAGHAAVLGACLNVRANLPSLAPEQRPELLEAEVSALEQRAAALLSETLALGRS
ncbi:MAG: glutamate formimidoyltransferase [Sphingomonadaceae bacterium]